MDANAAGIDKSLLTEPVNRSQLVLDLDGAQVTVDRLLELDAAVGSAAIIEAANDEAAASQPAVIR